MIATVAVPAQAVDLTVDQAQAHAQAATALCNRKQRGTVWAEFDGLQCQCMGRRFAARLPAAQPDVLQPGSPAHTKALAFAARGCRNPFGVKQALAPGFLPGEPLAGTTLMSRPAAATGQDAELPPPGKPAAARPAWKAPDMQMELLTSHCAALAPGGVEAVRARCACFARGYLAANPPGSASVAAVDLLAFKSAAADPATFQRLGGACLSRAAAALPAPG